MRVVVTGTNAGGIDDATSAPSAVVAGNPPVNDVAPVLSGSAVDGQTLSADDGDWSGTTPLNTATYQWQRCDEAGAGCTDISGATNATYTLAGPDIDGTVRAVVTVTNAWGTDQASTAPSAVVAAALPVITIDPAVLGTAVDGQTVTADPGIWSGTPPVTYDYQWLRCDLDGTDCVDIAGADQQDYVLTGADTGHGIRVEVTATNAAGSVAATSPVASVDAAAPQNTTAPSVSFPDTLRDGQTVTADPGVWSGTAPVTFDYQWLRCDATGQTCALIGGATEQTYILGASDVGGQVRVSVTATNAGGNAQASSPAGPASAVVAADPPQATSDPIVTGVATDGATLSAGTGGWTGTGPLVYEFQWQRCDADGTNCTDILGATTSTHTLTSSDVDGSVRVEVTATNSAGSDTSVSQPSSAISAAPPVSVTPPAIAGSPVDGQTLTADHGAFTGTTPTYAYQWQRCDTDGSNCADIAGADQASYDLVPADVGAAVLVVVTATNAAGSDTATSAVTAEIQPLAPQNTTPPSITGSVLDGHTLNADPGTWTGHVPDVHLPVAALRRRRHQLRRSPRRDRSRLHARPRRHRPRPARRRDGRQRRPRQRAQRLGADRGRPGRPARQHGRADRVGHSRGRPDAHGRPRQLVGHHPGRPTTTSGSAATPTPPTASTSPARPRPPTRSPRATSATPSSSR